MSESLRPRIFSPIKGKSVSVISFHLYSSSIYLLYHFQSFFLPPITSFISEKKLNFCPDHKKSPSMRASIKRSRPRLSELIRKVGDRYGCTTCALTYSRFVFQRLFLHRQSPETDVKNRPEFVKRHQMSSHNPDATIFRCLTCCKTFSRSDVMIRHQRR